MCRSKKKGNYNQGRHYTRFSAIKEKGKLAAYVSLWTWILDKTHIPGLNPRSAESEFLGMGPRNLPLKKVPLSSKVCFEIHQQNRIA